MTTAVLTYAEAAAGIEAVTSAYTQALDAERPADVVALFADGGIFEIPGWNIRAEGKDALLGAFQGFGSERPRRHVIVNPLITSWSDTDATVSNDLLVVEKTDAGWAITLVGRYDDTLRRVDGDWRFTRRTLAFID
jgi:hypothetical protein